MELLALDKPIKKPPRSDARDGDLFCGTQLDDITIPMTYTISGDGTITVPNDGYCTVSYHWPISGCYATLKIGSNTYSTNDGTLDATSCLYLRKISAGDTYTVYSANRGGGSLTLYSISE